MSSKVLSSSDGRSATPGFFGLNPAVVRYAVETVVFLFGDVPIFC